MLKKNVISILIIFFVVQLSQAMEKNSEIESKQYDKLAVLFTKLAKPVEFNESLEGNPYMMPLKEVLMTYDETFPFAQFQRGRCSEVMTDVSDTRKRKLRTSQEKDENSESSKDDIKKLTNPVVSNKANQVIKKRCLKKIKKDQDLYCNKELGFERALKQQYTVQHQPSTGNICQECGYKGISPALLRRHQAADHTTKLTCNRHKKNHPSCKGFYMSIGALRQHYDEDSIS